MDEGGKEGEEKETGRGRKNGRLGRKRGWQEERGVREGVGDLRIYIGDESRHYTAHQGLLLVKVAIKCMLGTPATRYLPPDHRSRAWPAVRGASTPWRSERRGWWEGQWSVGREGGTSTGHPLPLVPSPPSIFSSLTAHLNCYLHV